MKSRLAFFLAMTQVLVVFVSWLVAAVAPSLSIRSLLGGEGIRWFFGGFASRLSQPLLGWIILLSLGYSAYRVSGLHDAVCQLFNGRHFAFSQRYGLWVVVAELILVITVMLLLTIVPQAILLSSTGELFPDSSFCRSLIPVVAFTLSITSLSYGLASGSIKGIRGLYDALTAKMNLLPQILLFYVLIVQLYYSVMFVVGS
jgi:aminobenzoyl-glutamate transport protein